MKQDCIDSICKLPVALNQGYKSLSELLSESQFQLYHQEISTTDIIQYLQTHPDLLNVWRQYSDDNRTSAGFYYQSKYIGSTGDLKFEKTFTSDTEVYAEFILKEISFWLQIKYE